ncbi:Cationic peroxidase 2 [Vitis vinifera]|uniref:peroxidase n=1 Tax=Vitis vinifera TaxID=29760 RepID=A0A438GRN9_VITVI|nr:Cationic peroxidase 2 [Vitis vinifera]
MAAALVQGQGTRVGFYSRTCPQAESIVQNTVQGCDASILINGTSTEKTTVPNSLINGYDVIDDAKTQLEAACPGVVSCADILALAARDSVVLVTFTTNVESAYGRRDGRVSLASDVNNLPSPRDSIEAQKQKFADKGLTDQDLVTLVGGHTIGTSACQFFRYRLYNFSTTTANGADPSMDATFVTQLQALCPADGDGSRRIALDTEVMDGCFHQNFSSALPGVRGLRGLNFNVEFGTFYGEDEQHWGEDRD